MTTVGIVTNVVLILMEGQTPSILLITAAIGIALFKLNKTSTHPSPGLRVKDLSISSDFLVLCLLFAAALLWR